MNNNMVYRLREHGCLHKEMNTEAQKCKKKKKKRHIFIGMPW